MGATSQSPAKALTDPGHHKRPPIESPPNPHSLPLPSLSAEQFLSISSVERPHAYTVYTSDNHRISDMFASLRGQTL